MDATYQNVSSSIIAGAEDVSEVVSETEKVEKHE